MKKFWKKTEGFTLVELIVVIAILGILAGVGTVGYSGYIKKANMAADQTLVREVANALMLGLYSDTNTANGAVVISKSGTSASENLEQCLEDAFGNGWADLALKYDGWSDDGLLALAASQKYASSVNQSSYIQNSSVTELLDNVQAVTSAAGALLDTKANAETKYTAMQRIMPSNFTDLCEQAGIKTNEAGTAFADDVTNDQLANLMVLSVSQELAGLTEDEIAALVMGGGSAEGVTVSDATKLAAMYAGYKAIALGTGEEEHFNTMNTALSNATGLDDVNTALNNFWATAPEGVIEKFANYDVTTDAQAFAAIIGAVNEVSDSYLDAETLADKNLYTSGAVANHLNSYVAAAGAAGSVGAEEVATGTVAVIISNGVVGVTPANAYLAN